MLQADELIRLNAAYFQLTGENFYLYTSRPGDGQVRVVFTDGVKRGLAAGIEHMRMKLLEVTA